VSLEQGFRKEAELLEIQISVQRMVEELDCSGVFPDRSLGKPPVLCLTKTAGWGASVSEDRG